MGSGSVAAVVRTRGAWVGAAAALVLAAGIGGYLWWLEMRIEPPKTIADDGLEETLYYAFLNEDFNRLPVERRLEILRDIVQQLRDMGQQDSLIMAMFASMIAGEAREQMMENVSRLAVDSIDELATDYDPSASDAEREAYLLDAWVRIEETLETIAGIDRDISPQERIADRRREAQREMASARESGLPPGDLARGFDVMNNEIGAYATGHQKRRISTMMRDMARVMRADPDGSAAAAAGVGAEAEGSEDASGEGGSESET